MEGFETILIPVLLAIATAVGWFARRWITGAQHTEDAESIKQAVELKVFLDDKGISLPDAKRVRDDIRQGRQPITPVIAKAMSDNEIPPTPLTEGEIDTLNNRVDFRETSVGMKLGMSLRLDQLDADIDYLVTTLCYDATEARRTAIENAQIAWKAYRVQEAEVAGLLFEGGSGAPLLSMSREIEMSEFRKDELDRMIANEAQL